MCSSRKPAVRRTKWHPLSGNAEASNYNKMDSSRIDGTVAAIGSTRKQPRLQFQVQLSLKSGGNVDTWLREDRTLTASCKCRIKFESNERTQCQSDAKTKCRCMNIDGTPHSNDKIHSSGMPLVPKSTTYRIGRQCRHLVARREPIDSVMPMTTKFES